MPGADTTGPEFEPGSAHTPWGQHSILLVSPEGGEAPEAGKDWGGPRGCDMCHAGVGLWVLLAIQIWGDIEYQEIQK